MIDIMPLGFRPMLAAKLDLKRIQWPLLVQPKLDGIRAIVHNGQALSRTLKPIPNSFVQAFFELRKNLFEGLDGELIVGDPIAKDVFQKTTSGIMSEAGEPNFTFYAFDFWHTFDPAYKRRGSLIHWFSTNAKSLNESGNRIQMLPAIEVNTPERLEEVRESYLQLGYEGLIARQFVSNYKYGRATANQGSLLKWKEFVDEEATVIDFQELMHNENEAVVDKLGLTKRSSHKDNKIPGNTLGALIVRSDRYGGVFNVGSGFDQVLRQQIWNNKERYLGKLVKFKHFPIGQKDLPRHPIFLGFRDPIDL